ncbi:MAG: hypothetical protein AAF497_02275, partial [Planctomycetota bacterium]
DNAGTAGFRRLEDAGTGWGTITLDGTIPGNANSATPLVIVVDGANGGPVNGTGSGIAVYVDNIHFAAGTSSSVRPKVENGFTLAPITNAGRDQDGSRRFDLVVSNQIAEPSVDLTVHYLSSAMPIRDGQQSQFRSSVRHSSEVSRDIQALFADFSDDESWKRW